MRRDDPLEPHPATRLLAAACRVLAHTGLAPDVLGHVSLRVGEDVLIRCRGPVERGLAFTEPSDLVMVDRAGGGAPEGWSPPNELPIHTSVLAARPDVTVVVHTHPPALVATTVAGIRLEPIVGAYDITACRLAADGIPVWGRAALVNTPALGDEVARTLGDRAVAALYGHGLVSVGVGEPEVAVAEAVVRAVSVERLARMTLTVLGAGGTLTPIAKDDLEQLPDLGTGFTALTMWRHLAAAAGCS